jgi:hypothetical protein
MGDVSINTSTTSGYIVTHMAAVEFPCWIGLTTPPNEFLIEVWGPLTLDLKIVEISKIGDVLEYSDTIARDMVKWAAPVNSTRRIVLNAPSNEGPSIAGCVPLLGEKKTSNFGTWTRFRWQQHKQGRYGNLNGTNGLQLSSRSKHLRTKFWLVGGKELWQSEMFWIIAKSAGNRLVRWV